jgi:hypothetical protein
MRVNINGVWYDANDMPIQIELTDRDKENIVNMHPDAHNYIVFPDSIKYEKVKELLKINADK